MSKPSLSVKIILVLNYMSLSFISFYHRIRNKIIFLIYKNIKFNAKYKLIGFPKFVFGTKPIASKKIYLNLHNSYKKKKFRNVLNFEKKFRKRINRDFINSLALKTQVVIKKNSKINYEHGKLLYAVLFDLIKKKKFNFINILEIGTARGFSSICMSKALIDSRQNGKITTIDILSNNEKMYWNCIDDHNGPLSRRELLVSWKDEIKNIKFVQDWSLNFIYKNSNSKKRYQFAFLDGAHDYDTVLREFIFVSGKQKVGDMVFFDDISKNEFNDLYMLKKFLIENFKNYAFQYIKCTRQRSYMLAKKIK